MSFVNHESVNLTLPLLLYQGHGGCLSCAYMRLVFNIASRFPHHSAMVRSRKCYCPTFALVLTWCHFSDARNNTTQPNLTYYERSLLRKDSAARRIGGDSFKPLDACNLCLSQTSEPTSCPKGHLYCRECVISSLITQKAGIETQRREMERWEVNERREREDGKRAARERVVRDFERGMALGGRGGRMRVDDQVGNGEGRGKGDGVGRFEFDGETVEKVAREAEENAMRMIEVEQVEARKSKLAAFWLPSLTPEAKLGPLKDVKLHTMCHVGGTPHPISYVPPRTRPRLTLRPR